MFFRNKNKCAIMKKQVFKGDLYMKKYMVIILTTILCTLVFFTSGCSFLPSLGPIDKPNDDPIDDPVVEDGKYVLGYGDYITSITSLSTAKIEEEYNKLRTVVKGKVDGIYQTSYEQGLLDIFDYENKVSLTINISKNELQTLTDYYNIHNEESYRLCSIDLQLGDLIIHLEKVGIRQKGNTSRGVVINGDGSLQLRHYKLCFSETFDDKFRTDVVNLSDEEKIYLNDRSLFGLEKLDIRFNRNQDATYLKEFYSYEMYRANGVLAPRTNLCNVQMNIDGNTQNAGVYLMVETVDKDFLKRNLLKEYTTGDLYKLGWTNVGATFDNVDSSLFGVETQYSNGNDFYSQKYPYDLKTNKKTSTHTDVKNFINNVVNTSNTDFYNMMQTYSIYDEFISYLAVSYLLGDPDDLRGNYNNTYIYFVPSSDGINKIIFMPTDNDRSLGSTGGSNPTGHNGTGNGPYSPRTGYSENWSPLFRKSIIYTGEETVGNEQIKKDYVAKIESIITNGWMNTQTFEKYFNVAKNHYQNDIVLGNLFNDNDVHFGLVENNNVNDNWNLSISVYLSEKLKSFNNKK